MLSISILRPVSQDFLTTIKSSTNISTSIALAKAISSTLALPTVAIDDKDYFFIENLSSLVRETAGKINELMITDVGKVIEYSKMFWNIRYVLCHGGVALYPVQGCTSAADVFGYGSLITKEVSDQIEADHFAICSMIKGFTAVIADVSASQESA